MIWKIDTNDVHIDNIASKFDDWTDPFSQLLLQKRSMLTT